MGITRPDRCCSPPAPKGVPRSASRAPVGGRSEVLRVLVLGAFERHLAGFVDDGPRRQG